MTDYPSKPEFATNRTVADERETVAGALNAMLAAARNSWKHPPRADIATAYFNPAGFNLLADELSSLGAVRLLLGAEPDPSASRPTIRPLSEPRGRTARRRTERATAERILKESQIDRDLLGFSRAADQQARRLVEWLRSESVEVRSYQRGFLHGKAFIIQDESEAQGVLAGSSNFTLAGLAFNNELNLGQYQPGIVKLVTEWFAAQWDESVPFDLAALYEARWEPHRPWDVFLRMLLELYGSDLEHDEKKTALGLTAFQADGVWRAARILARRNGVLIADEVGLGKTFTAGELIHQAMRERRQKVLIIAPATLRDTTWKPFLQARNLQTDVLSFEELVRDIDRAGHPGVTLQSLDEYAMVVVDEAHYLRSPNALRADAMRKLLGGAVPKDLVLLTATPVNNSLMDLYQLISYFAREDAAFNDVGIASLSAYFKEAQDRDPEDLAPEHLFDVLDAVAVRRTRKFVKRHYLNDQVEFNGQVIRIQFPTSRVRRVDYELGGHIPGFFDRFSEAIGGKDHESPTVEIGVILDAPGEVLTMARYVPTRFLIAGETEQYQAQNAGLLRSNLLKRFESSATAFRATVGRMIESHDAFLSALDAGWVLTGDALRDWAASDSDEFVELSGEGEEARDQQAAALFDQEALREAVFADRELLAGLRDDLAPLTWEVDPKIQTLINELKAIVHQAEREGVGEQDIRDKRKVLIFTYFADTARYIAQSLEAAVEQEPSLVAFKGRMAMLTGSDSVKKEELIAGFAPRTAGTSASEDLFDLVVTTDVLAEGVNLQQARNIVNYDLPWNPMRLVQRHGRIDRIGSTHTEIFLRCFFPDRDLDQLLRLEERLQRKLRQAAAAVGVGEVLPGVAAVERDFTQTREEILRLQQEDAALFSDEGAAVSGEEYRRQLIAALAHPDRRERIEDLPWGSGSGFVSTGGTPGFVFCARIADAKEAVLRYVPLDSELVVNRDADGNAEIYAERGTCLAQAEPLQIETPFYLPDDYLDAAFDAWEAARQHIFDEWQYRTDPRNLTPAVPAVMRRAADLVRRAGTNIGGAQDDLVARLNAAVAPRVQREIARVLGTPGRTDAELVVALQSRVAELGLQIPRPPEPNQPIELEDVRLVCWVANVVEPDPAIAGDQ